MQRNRFRDALWFEKARNTSTKVIIGGAGGIGSWLAFFLIRAGMRVEIYDFDLVEEHNLGGQLFMADAIGKPKVEALEDVIGEFNFESVNFVPRNEKVENFAIPGQYFTNNYTYIFASCFDNMKAREEFFNMYDQVVNSSNEGERHLFIDGRLLMEQMTIFNINSQEKREEYVMKYLFSDDEVEDAPCTMKQVSHGAAMIASHMTGFITNFLANRAMGDDAFALPFSWEYLIPMNYSFTNNLENNESTESSETEDNQLQEVSTETGRNEIPEPTQATIHSSENPV